MRVRDDAVDTAAALRLCVLSSGSAGNCSVLRLGMEADSPLCLIDLGLSPRRTASLLREQGLSLGQVRAALVTHFDHDHFHRGWTRADAHGIRLLIHETHAEVASVAGIVPGACTLIGSECQPVPGLRVQPILNRHDDCGTAAFRISAGNATLGFATDLGFVTDALVAHLRGVDVLAIESNYCPRLQMGSNRPAFLKERIMGGSGHLSNEQAAEAIRRIEPREHVVLLHLSSECNHPELVARMHEGADYAITISRRDAPTRWIMIRPPGRPAARIVTNPTLLSGGVPA